MKGDARARFMLAGAAALLLCAGGSFLMLLPSYFILAKDASGMPPKGSSISPQQNASDRTVIASAKALLAQVSPIIAATTTPTDAIIAALSVRPSGVHVDQINYMAGSPSSLMLVGSAASTNAISAYRTALAGNALFTSVSIPVGALVGTDGGRFSITLSGNF